MGALVWITGASSGIGAALVRTLPWSDAEVIGVARRAPSGCAHLPADLATEEGWAVLARDVAARVAGGSQSRVVLVHAAGSLDPVGFAREVDPAAYTRNVLLNAAAPQVIGQAFLAATAGLPVRRDLVLLTSGAAHTVYPGWSSYGAGKAAVDQWCRTAGAEEAARDGAVVLAVAPGVVATAMQERLRATPEASFPARERFVRLHEQGRLADPDEVAARIWGVVDAGFASGSVLDLRDLPPPGAAP